MARLSSTSFLDFFPGKLAVATELQSRLIHGKVAVLFHLYQLVRTMTFIFMGLSDKPIFTHQVSTIILRCFWVISLRVSRNGALTMIITSSTYRTTLIYFYFFLSSSTSSCGHPDITVPSRDVGFFLCDCDCTANIWSYWWTEELPNITFVIWDRINSGWFTYLWTTCSIINFFSIIGFTNFI